MWVNISTTDLRGTLSVKGENIWLSRDRSQALTYTDAIIKMYIIGISFRVFSTTVVITIRTRNAAAETVGSLTHFRQEKVNIVL